ncbi:thiamine phosphate synthase, partial [Anaerotignum lactatifermentans]
AEAEEAEKLGATYITAGHIYATDCKKGLPPRGLTFLEEVCRRVSIPVYAIGGIKINEKQLREVIDCGAKGGCIMSGMMQL